MGQFHCRVADAEGRVFSHVEPASSLEEARQKLVDRGLYVYSVQARGARLAGLVRKKSGRQIGGSEFLILNQQFNTLIKAGLPILKSLDLLASRATSPKLRPVITQIRDRVREGKSLSEAVAEAGVFSKVYSTAILAGEKSGNLPGVLDYYIAYQRVSTNVRKKILATLVYPVLLITVAIIIVTYLVTAVIPKFALLYRDLNVELPTPTRLLIALTVDYRFVVLGLVVLMAVAAGGGFFFFPPVERGGGSGALSPMLNSVAEFYEEEVNLRLSALVSLIEPILLIFMGLLVAFILISLYLPIFSFSMMGATK